MTLDDAVRKKSAMTAVMTTRPDPPKEADMKKIQLFTMNFITIHPALLWNFLICKITGTVKVDTQVLWGDNVIQNDLMEKDGRPVANTETLPERLTAQPIMHTSLLC
ncbi:hypothetical protein CAEBREN_13733 [Caenorhabditis brenneri]|uniref:Uncharacterized protein n=1 Tax=Caenorhabditis brenneri TaxID=135651 RepID=G0P1F6_CAEBE|nr:hypothetical protein CAEBREN_13733 [Caenorhabditis brenneri]